MNLVFADTLYWVARLRPGDPWRDASRRAEDRLGRCTTVTTEEALTETMNAVAGGGASLRLRAVVLADQLSNRPDVVVVPQSHASYLAGLDLYERRLDKGYSLTDCISMNAMRERGIADVLTNDHHFEQEGFNVLIRR